MTNPLAPTKPKKKGGRKIIWDPTEVLTGVPNTRKVNPALNEVYYYPNRPVLMPADPANIFNPSRDYIDSLEATGKYIAELKWNGDNTLIYTSTNTWWNRHHAHLAYHPSPEVLEEMAEIFPSGCIINAETVNRCTKKIKNKIVVHCLMGWKGELLLGKTWGDSRKILEGLKFGTHVVLSQVWTSGFWNLFKQAWDMDESIEGIILKNPKGKLVHSTKPFKDLSWMLKIRKPSKKYAC